MPPEPMDPDEIIRFEVTGSAAHSRLAPLIPSHWRDVGSHAASSLPNSPAIPHFLWENAPRHTTRQYRDSVCCYSHLPNGTAILDDKWVLARFFTLHDAGEDKMNDPALAILESHCFRGLTGFRSFCDKVDMWTPIEVANESAREQCRLPDLLQKVACDSHGELGIRMSEAPSPRNFWVVKDANSNGAGGIWIVDPRNAKDMIDPVTSPMLEEHRYVAQRYAWPPLLYDGRKFHVRVYGLMTCDGRAFVHKRAFLHVANELYHPGITQGSVHDRAIFEPSRHITNCCANSHDDSKFSGEICADLDLGCQDQSDERGCSVIPLAKFFPSIAASVSTLAQESFPFLRGGDANNGMEYLGMDFILSYSSRGLPVAYLLEVNAPPSQDTATGLAHAEDLHDDIIRDILSLWVLPKVTGAAEDPSGFKCVYDDREEYRDNTGTVPSKAAILNKIRWAIYERKAKNDYEMRPKCQSCMDDTILGVALSSQIARLARSNFPFFNGLADTSGELSSSTVCTSSCRIFFESAGGAQVPAQVTNAVYSSLCERDRCVLGRRYTSEARETLLTILGGRMNDHGVFLGANATSLIEGLSQAYVDAGLLTSEDEIVVCTENHLANVKPWLRVAGAVGAAVKWWDIDCDGPFPVSSDGCSQHVEDLVTPRTRIVAISHASNLVGRLRDIASICRVIKEKSLSRAHVVVDGVAAVPHANANLSESSIDWYAVSCHKLFGPHLGALCGLRTTISQLHGGVCDDEDEWTGMLEKGTISYEACAGVIGLGKYLQSLAACPLKLTAVPQTQSSSDASVAAQLSTVVVNEAYRRILLVEAPLVELLLSSLSACRKVRIIGNTNGIAERIPIVSFLHSGIPSFDIVKRCRDSGIACRASKFLSTERLQRSLRFGLSEDSPVRISLAHYNTVNEVKFFLATLTSIPGWT